MTRRMRRTQQPACFREAATCISPAKLSASVILFCGYIPLYEVSHPRPRADPRRWQGHAEPRYAAGAAKASREPTSRPGNSGRIFPGLSLPWPVHQHRSRGSGTVRPPRVRRHPRRGLQDPAPPDAVPSDPSAGCWANPSPWLAHPDADRGGRADRAPHASIASGWARPELAVVQLATKGANRDRS